jgi:hypothetical protein
VKHTVSIFRAEMAMLGIERIYIGLAEGKDEPSILKFRFGFII